ASLARKPDASTAVTGVFFSHLTYRTGKTLTSDNLMFGDGFVVGLDQLGQGSWARQIKGQGIKSMVDLQPTDDGWIAVAQTDGAFDIDNTSGDPPVSSATVGVVLKIRVDGTVAWFDEFELLDGSIAAPRAVAVDPMTGDIFVVGDAQGTLFVARKPNP